jgi:hypothetical protein
MLGLRVDAWRTSKADHAKYHLAAAAGGPQRRALVGSSGQRLGITTMEVASVRATPAR